MRDATILFPDAGNVLVKPNQVPLLHTVRASNVWFPFVNVPDAFETVTLPRVSKFPSAVVQALAPSKRYCSKVFEGVTLSGAGGNEPATLLTTMEMPVSCVILSDTEMEGNVGGFGRTR